MSYSRYTNGDGHMRHITLSALIAENEKTGLLIARHENSGCEGCYVEVAKWNDANRRYERYAFEKYFGGEHPTDDTDGNESCFVTAAKFANDINLDGSTADEGLIHSLPSWEGGAA